MVAYHFKQGDRPLDGYTIQYAIGRGGFGEVYFAVSDSGREVALKAVQNFEEVELRGISHCMNLKSPHLVMIFDVRFSADRTPWVIMEFVSGPSLRDILDESPDGLGPEQAQFFLRELAKGLSYLHEAGVVHRDLKPHNVFFEDGLVKIGDYSLSKVITNSHRSGNTMTVGSVHYMAPEISLGRYDKTVDIYALGVMLHEMLTGTPPYVGESMGEVLMKHLSSEPDLSQVPEPFAGVIAKAMQRDPADRFQTAEEMVRAVADSESAVPLDDSFNPATLSLVGERVQREKAARAAAVVQAPADIAVDRQPVTPGTAPTAAVDVETSQYEAAVAAADDSDEPESRGILHRLCLHYRPAARLHDLPDLMSLPVRLTLACLATLCLIGLGAMLESTVIRSWAQVVLLSLSVLVVSGSATALGSRWLPFHGLFWTGIVARFFWLVCVGVPAVILLRLVDGPYAHQVGTVVLSAVAVFLIFDWRCLIAADRVTRVEPVITMAIGVLAATMGAWMDVRRDIHLMSAAMAMAAAISIQLLAAHRHAAPDAPRVPPRPASKKPRLLYDLPAMILELVVAGSAALFLMVAVNASDGAFVMMVGLITFVVGGFALRFRLHRRDWPKQAVEPPIRAADPEPSAAGVVQFNWFNVLLELIAGVCAIGFVVAVIEGDDDFFLAGAFAFVFGILAVRLRLARRESVPRQPASGSRLSFDGFSVFLELLVGLCAVVSLFAVVESRHEEIVVLGCVAAALGVVALRFRLARRVTFTRQSGDASRLSEERAAGSGNEERREIHS